MEIALSLLGVVIGGVIGLGGTYLQTKNQRHLRRREEILPVASRALAAAEETYQAYMDYAYPRVKSPEPPTREELSEFMTNYIEVRRGLTVSLYQLSLLMPDIEEESQHLRDSLAYEKIGKIRGPELRANYDTAREKLQKRIRQYLDM